METGQLVKVSDDIEKTCARIKQCCSDLRTFYLDKSPGGSVAHTTNVLSLLAEAYQWAGEINRIAKLNGIDDAALDIIRSHHYMSGSESARRYQYTTNDKGEA